MESKKAQTFSPTCENVVQSSDLDSDNTNTPSTYGNATVSSEEKCSQALTLDKPVQKNQEVTVYWNIRQQIILSFRIKLVHNLPARLMRPFIKLESPAQTLSRIQIVGGG